MAISDVKVKIDLTKPTGSVGFGMPLILRDKAETSMPYGTFRNVSEISEVCEDQNVINTATLLFMQDNPPEKIAVCCTSETAADWITDVNNQSKDWRQAIVIGGTTTTGGDLNALCNEFASLDGKVLFLSLPITDTEERAKDNDRVLKFYCTDSTYKYPVAALVGATAGLSAGSFTYKNIILKGISPQPLTPTELDAIHAKNGITFVAKAGDNVTSEGKVASGEFADIIDSEDWIIQQIEYRTQKLLNKMKKVPYDDTGIAMLENECISVLKEAANNGMIAYDKATGTYEYSTNYALSEDTLDSDRALRKYVGGQFSFKLSGAVHTVEVTGEIII